MTIRITLFVNMGNTRTSNYLFGKYLMSIQLTAVFVVGCVAKRLIWEISAILIMAFGQFNYNIDDKYFAGKVLS